MKAALLAAVLLPRARAWQLAPLEVAEAARSSWRPAVASSRRPCPVRLLANAEDDERLLLSEKGLSAFIVAEMRDFVTEAMGEMDRGDRTGWKLTEMERMQLGLASEERPEVSGAEAVSTICQTTECAFHEGYNSPGLLSQLGSAISYFRNYFSEEHLIPSLERVGLSGYSVAHHITDMYHHRVFRGTYTKTLQPSGSGEVAARLAVGLPPMELAEAEGDGEVDECLIWSPSGACLQTKAEEVAWRKRRFEKVQMEGTRDPRRGGSGTTR